MCITRKAYDLTWKHERAYVENGCMDTMRFTQKKQSLKVMRTKPGQAFGILGMGGNLWALFSSQFQDEQQKEKRHTSEGNWVSDDDGLGYQASWHVSQHTLLQRDITAYFAHCRHLFLQSVCGMSFVYTSTIMNVWSSPHLLRLVSCVIASAFFSIRSHFNFLTSASSLRPFFIFIFYLGHCF